jgi:hypothetical protein
MLRTRFLIVAATIVMAACSASGGAGGSGVPTPVATDAPSAVPGVSGDVSLPASITDPIVADAATQLGVDPSAVTVVDAHAETWPDSSLGCPEPGMMYTQSLVDGYQVIVEANGTQLDYRGSADQFFVCENP